MNVSLSLFTPTKNRRLNELVAFCLFVLAVLVTLALASYSPSDPSWNTVVDAARPHNWIGLFGAHLADFMLQILGLGAFAVPVLIAALSLRWWRSHAVNSGVPKVIGAVLLLAFFPALIGLLPWHLRWRSALPFEGLEGRILADSLVDVFNVAGAWIIGLAVIAVAVILTTTFTLGGAQLWFTTRLSFVVALRDRFQDWRINRARAKAAKKEAAAQKRAEVQVQARAAQRQPRPTQREMDRQQVVAPAARTQTVEPVRAMAEEWIEEDPGVAEPLSVGITETDEPEPEIEFGSRADENLKSKTVLPKAHGSFKLPPSSLLQRPDEHARIDHELLKEQARQLTEKCAEFGVRGHVAQINPGPVVTTFEMKPEAGMKYARFTSLSDDLCLAMSAESVLIERMAGKSTVGIQVPNAVRETIFLREVVESEDFATTKQKLPLAMGKDINGRIVTADLATMPHLLIAGSTGSGKSVAINAMIMSVLFKATPDQVRMILVDPKRVELGNYEGVPHLYTPIITEPKLASVALRNAVKEMERRLKLLAAKGVRNLDQYNRLFEGTASLFEPEVDEAGQEHRPLPYIVIIIDELADLMMLDGANVEESITRLAQMARAVGIHLVLATQRPSVDVITGLIKANVPARVSFRVATKIDSRTILDGNGAESLLGKGDMLYLPSGSARTIRVHAPFVTEKEIEATVEFWKSQGQAQYEQRFLEAPKDDAGKDLNGDLGGDDEEEDDPMFNDAVKLVLEFGKASTSLLQRRLRIGYGRAAHLIDLMEKDGIVGPADGPRPREILKRPDWINEVEDAMR
ncbi:MAG TPA: DNA translocase FtsK 4TM domain-containing protein [Terriglobales bacterium]|jgi:S-DNA-T family DNA segregation ATPase FtsK/SpoIIIE